MPISHAPERRSGTPNPRIRIPALASIVLLVWTTASGVASAQSFVFEETTFDDASWDQTVQVQGNGGTANRAQITDGNPGPSADIDIALNTPGSASSGISSAAWLFSIASIHSYDPAAGASVSIDYSEDAIMRIGQGNGHATALALRQDGILYLSFARRLFTPETSWTTKTLSNLVQSDFRSIASAANPDFSSNGSPIEFGYVRGNSSPPGSSSAFRVTGIDN